MRRLHPHLTLLVAMLLLCTHGWAAAEPAETAADYSAQAYALLDQESGRILAAQNENLRLPMASTTKVMTALVVIENAQMDEEVLVGANASGVEGSSIYLSQGEVLTVEQLLYGLMLKSGNDAAVALAEHVGGDLASFVDMMNQRAAALGLGDTHFANPHGLTAEGHYTTAYELAQIAREAMKHELFRTLVATQRTTIPWPGNEWNRALKNGNKLLTQYPDCIGIKTGYTKNAGRCLVSAARRGGMTLICTVLNAPDMYGDSRALFEYGFDSYTLRQVATSGERFGRIRDQQGRTSSISVQESLILPMKRTEVLERKLDLPSEVSLPISPGYPIGDLCIYIGGQEVARVALCIQEGLGKRTYFEEIRHVLTNW